MPNEDTFLSIEAFNFDSRLLNLYIAHLNILKRLDILSRFLSTFFFAHGGQAV